jgi:hypothetical protein
MPTYLCDSDVEKTDALNKIVGLAFVLYEDEPVLSQMDGMQHVYKVSSFYNSDSKTVHHVRSFRSIPGTDHFTSCFPSTIFKQILRLKSKIQQALNTRSVRSDNSFSTNLHNPNLSKINLTAAFTSKLTLFSSSFRLNILSSCLLLKSPLMIVTSQFCINQISSNIIDYSCSTSSMS